MTSSAPGESHTEIERNSVRRDLFRAASPTTLLDIAGRTGLSTLVLVPTLEGLIEEREVVREAAGVTPEDRGHWCYRLSAEGRRRYRSASR